LQNGTQYTPDELFGHDAATPWNARKTGVYWVPASAGMTVRGWDGPERKNDWWGDRRLPYI
jgi:hypothetical protein